MTSLTRNKGGVASSVRSVSLELWAWWDALPVEQQRELLFIGDCEPTPDFALALWRTSGVVHVVEPESPSIHADPARWRLTIEARDFVGMRQHERLHPEDR